MTTTAGWMLLVASGVLDVFWALATKKSDGALPPLSFWLLLC
jgi:multidrug transporter EmrE-like cation transporter